MNTSEQGRNFIKEFEGLNLERYKCPAGVWTIGWGHAIKSNENLMDITLEYAEQLLSQDIAIAEACLNKLVTVKLNQNQFDALVDFVFNLGCGQLRVSTLLKRINAGLFKDAANEFPRWVYSNGVKLNGLIRRRTAEQELFLS